MLDLAAIRLCAFDQDGTLYAYSPDFETGIRSVQADVLHTLTQGRIGVEDAFRLCERSYHETGSGWTLPGREYGISARTFHAEFHAQVSCQYVEPPSGLRHAFAAAHDTGLESVIITHSHMNYASRVVRKLMIDDHFPAPRIITLEQVDYREKSDDEAMFIEANRRTGIPAHETLVIEDSLRNLHKARAIGQKTAYVHWGRPLDALPPQVDLQFETPVDVLNAVGEARRKNRLAPVPANVLV